MRTMRCALLLGLCLALRAAEPDPDEVIKRVTERVAATTARIPNYTCVESVVRDFYWPAASIPPQACTVIMEERQHPVPDLSLRLAVKDRSRLDVTMTRTGEIFSWAGARRFSDTRLDQMVDGPITSGVFGGFLSIVFNQDVRQFTFKGNTEADGRTLMEYSFKVAPEHSSYKVNYSGLSVKSGYSGTVLVDPVTDDVVRLTVKSNALPEANTCEISTDLDLTRVKIGDSEFLLPRQARQRYVTTTAEEVENETSLAQCREYSGTSTVSFGAPEPRTGTSLHTGAAPTRVPANQRFTFELTAPIASLTAAAGDAFSGRLLTPLRDARRKKMAPAGSLVEGRLLRVERHLLDPAFTIIVLKVQRIEVADSEFELTAVRDRSREVAAKRRKGKVQVDIPLPLPSEKNAGVFRFEGDEVVVRRGFKSDWRTVDADPR